VTGVDLPNEAAGFIPGVDWKKEKIGEKWYIGDSFHSAIGQGYTTATPLQLANYAAALANGGTLYSPRVVNRIKKSDGKEEIENSEIINRNFIEPEIMKIVREGMRQTVVSGTAQQLQTLPVSSAGKTGTAQFGTENKTHGWYISFAPYEDARIAMVVLVEGEDDTHSAVPVTKDIYDWYFRR
jgi:penicillin-binding protein 2